MEMKECVGSMVISYFLPLTKHIKKVREILQNVKKSVLKVFLFVSHLGTSSDVAIISFIHIRNALVVIIQSNLC